MIPGRRVDWFPTLDSTMLEARRDPEPGRVVVADQQTQGMGRHGHTWHSPAHEGLYVSIVMAVPPAPFRTLSLGLAVRDAIGPVVDLRWPNDALIGGRKCAGILAQTEGEYVIAGIGVNVSQSRFPEGLDTPATSLAIEGIAISREELLVKLVSGWIDSPLCLLKKSCANSSARRVTSTASACERGIARASRAD